MLTLGPIGFAAPWILTALIALPILWLILRAVPPAPLRRKFPGVALLIGLKDEDTESDRTPWWLLLLRMLALAAVIIALAGPVLNPDRREAGSGPLLVLLDGGWAGAPQFARRGERLSALLDEAGRQGRTVAIMRLTTPEAPVFQSAEAWSARLPGLVPTPWAPGPALVQDAFDALEDAGRFDTFWMSDGLDFEGRSELLDALSSRGDVRVFQSARAVMGLAPPETVDGLLRLTAQRDRVGGEVSVPLAAHGRDPAGIARILAQADITFSDGETEGSVDLSLPSELRARITRFALAGGRSAGAVTLADDSLRRREVAMIAGREDREGLELLSPLHYLEQALEPTADVLSGSILDLLPANPDVVILADVARLAEAEETALIDWVDGGGMLLRFAGPRLAASDVSRSEEDPLLPVRLRAGGRAVGGAMSWGEPKALAPFPEGSPFDGLNVPDDVRVSAQVMAQPDPTLAARVVAELSDGTPLVTRKQLGSGQVVLFHVTANAEWSGLPLSGLFVQMLERLAVSSGATRPAPEELEGTVWTPVQVLNGFGELQDAGTRPGIDGPALVADPLGPDLLPGLYRGAERVLARNVIQEGDTLATVTWPASVPVEGLAVARETPLQGALLMLALALLLADAVASLALTGRLRAARAVTGAVALAIMLGTGFPGPAFAQTDGAPLDDAAAIAATSEVVLAHVITGDRALDQMARDGLAGLSTVLFARTSVEPAAPVGIDIETDELAFYPFLYWPVTPDQPLPSAEAYAKLNDYLRTGGMILFDTRDADVARFGASSPNGRHLQALAQPLDIPPLEPVPTDHVLTRAFYLLQDFPGRHGSRDVWVEAAPPDAEQVEGMPFRNLNDGVTPVVIGGNDWAAAWATDARGAPLFPVGRGFSGDRQRELAYRFGVNLIMHVLTGNYKSDQVHVPALLDRLGQ